MSLLLVPKHGETLQVNRWNWRRTFELLRAENVIGEHQRNNKEST